jgi:hypothetical protein
MRLVGDLLLIGQMDAGQFTLDMTDVDLAELVGEQDGICQVEVTEPGSWWRSRCTWRPG